MPLESFLVKASANNQPRLILSASVVGVMPMRCAQALSIIVSPSNVMRRVLERLLVCSPVVAHRQFLGE